MFEHNSPPWTLGRYRYLRSTYIHAFVGGASETRFKERLGDLFHEGYLDRPEAQWEFADARCRPVVHELGAKAARTLAALGEMAEQTYTFHAGRAHRQFLHSLMICEVLASIELAVVGDPRLRFIAWPEILARAPGAIRTSRTVRLPVPSGGYLVPDAVFGIEHQTGEAKTYRFFALEADRGTMPIARRDAVQTSLLGKFAAYDEIIARQLHKTYWGVPNLLVLTATTKECRLLEILRRVGGGHPAFLFKTVSESDLTRHLVQLLTEPWVRAGLPPLRISETS